MTAFDLESVKWTADGLVPAIAQDHATGAVLMMAWMNRESLAATLSTRDVTYWSRSRQALWRKGATSGHTQRLVTLSVDCDRDCVLMQVSQIGPACHTGRPTCFFTEIRDGMAVETSAPL